jgi:simple sugar transport system permease protein
LIIPVIAGLGLNFGIVVGIIAGQIAIVFVRYHYYIGVEFGGMGALMLCFLLAFPLAVLFGWLMGKLYNRTRGKEMIAGIVVSILAKALYDFLLFFAVGTIIQVRPEHPIIKFDNIGGRISVDLGARAEGGMTYAMDNIVRVPFMYVVLLVSLGILLYLVIPRVRGRKKAVENKRKLWKFVVYCGICAALVLVSLVSIITNNDLMNLREAPLVTGLVILALCLFTIVLQKTKLGQDFRSVGQSQHIAEISGIDVDRTRVIATIMSTVLAAWGMIIYLQSMGTLATYDSHRNIGLFSVAALLVGGASTSKASIKNALIGAALFNSMTIISPEISLNLFGSSSHADNMIYVVLGLALCLYILSHRAARDKNAWD